MRAAKAIVSDMLTCSVEAEARAKIGPIGFDYRVRSINGALYVIPDSIEQAGVLSDRLVRLGLNTAMGGEVSARFGRFAIKVTTPVPGKYDPVIAEWHMTQADRDWAKANGREV